MFTNFPFVSMHLFLICMENLILDFLLLYFENIKTIQQIIYGLIKVIKKCTKILLTSFDNLIALIVSSCVNYSSKQNRCTMIEWIQEIERSASRFVSTPIYFFFHCFHFFLSSWVQSKFVHIVRYPSIKISCSFHMFESRYGFSYFIQVYLWPGFVLSLFEICQSSIAFMLFYNLCF